RPRGWVVATEEADPRQGGRNRLSPKPMSGRVTAGPFGRGAIRIEDRSNLTEIASPCTSESAWGGIHEKESDRAVGRFDCVRGSRDVIRVSEECPGAGDTSTASSAHRCGSRRIA